MFSLLKKSPFRKVSLNSFSLCLKINKISFHKKKVFFKENLKLKNKEYSHKEIIIITITTNFKIFKLEVAPLPHYQECNQENKLQEYFFYLRKWRQGIEKKTLQITDKNLFSIAKKWNENIPFPALQWSISSLLLKFYYFKKRKKFPVKNNFLVTNLEKYLQENLKKQNLNFSHNVYKIKVGRKKIQQEILQLKKIVTNLKQGQKIRLDGNQLWNEKQLKYFLQEMKQELNFIEYIEEPTFNYSFFKNYKNQISFAIDETFLTKNKNLKQIIKQNFSAIIIKPSFIGCLSKINNWINWAKKNQIKITISSAFETKIGHQSIFELIYFLNLQKIYHGADTYRFLEKY